jgi:TRAP-type transport system periplasmic protein
MTNCLDFNLKFSKKENSMKTNHNLSSFIIGTIVSLVLMTGIVTGYCATPSKENPVILKYATVLPANHFLIDPETGPISRWARQVEEETGGRVKIKIYSAESLGRAKEMFDLARTGIADISQAALGYTPGYFPLASIAELPFPAPGLSYEVVAKAMWALKKQGLLDKKFEEVKVISLDPTDQNQLFLQKGVKKMDDLKGMKLRTSGGEWSSILHAWGAVPVPLTIADTYMGMQRGMIEGTPRNWAAAPSFKIY